MMQNWYYVMLVYRGIIYIVLSWFWDLVLASGNVIRFQMFFV